MVNRVTLTSDMNVCNLPASSVGVLDMEIDSVTHMVSGRKTPVGTQSMVAAAMRSNRIVKGKDGAEYEVIDPLAFRFTGISSENYHGKTLKIRKIIEGKVLALTRVFSDVADGEHTSDICCSLFAHAAVCLPAFQELERSRKRQKSVCRDHGRVLQNDKPKWLKCSLLETIPFHRFHHRFTGVEERPVILQNSPSHHPFPLPDMFWSQIFLRVAIRKPSSPGWAQFPQDSSPGEVFHPAFEASSSMPNETMFHLHPSKDAFPVTHLDMLTRRISSTCSQSKAPIFALPNSLFHRPSQTEQQSLCQCQGVEYVESRFPVSPIPMSPLAYFRIVFHRNRGTLNLPNPALHYFPCSLIIALLLAFLTGLAKRCAPISAAESGICNDWRCFFSDLCCSVPQFLRFSSEIWTQNFPIHSLADDRDPSALANQ
nr:hypothetical protein Iba_chr12dCG7660 [Ipomoea batatas]